MDNSPGIHDSADALCRAIGRHAGLCEREPRNRTAIAAAAAEVNKAVTDYAYAIFKKEGLDIFFAAPSEDPGQRDSTCEDTGMRQASLSGTKEFIIEDRFTIRVEDPRKLTEFTESAIGRRIQSSADSLLALCAKDGWKAATYPEEMLTVTYHAIESA